MNCGINNVRDFLVYLPRLTGYDHNEVVSYVTFKTLNLLLKCPKEKIDWDSLVAIFKSERWNDRTYRRMLQDIDWKSQILPTMANGRHRGCMCSRICCPTETVYYCFTCTTNPLYEICEYCFDESKHRGHSFTAKLVVRPEGRICHCGDPYVFKDPAFALLCKNDDNNGPRNFNPSFYDELALELINHVLDYLIDVMVYFAEQDGSCYSTDSVSHSNHTFLKDSKGQIDNGYPADMTWALQIDEEDCQLHYMDLTAKIARILNKPTEYAITMTNMLENGIPSVTILKSNDRSKLEEISSQFRNEGAKNHIRRIDDTFKRDLIEDLVEWLCAVFSDKSLKIQTRASLRLSMLDKWNSGLLSTKLTSGRLTAFTSKISLLGGFLVSYEQRDNFPWFKPWNFLLGNDRLSGIMSDYDKRLIDTNVPNSVNRYHTFHGSRFQYFLTEFPNIFSRVSRYRILKILCAMYAIADDARRCLSAQYLDVYLAVLYNAVASDHTGFKVSMMGIFSQYTFQDPETANIAIRSGFIQRTLRFAFTLMAFSPEDLIAYLPIPLYSGCRLPNETIRNRRTIICFKDICILMSTNTISQELLEEDEILTAIVEAFSEFNHILPLKRETSEHVEFENFDFSSYFFFFSSILILTDGYVRSISLLLDPEIRKSIVHRFINMAIKKGLEQMGHFKQCSIKEKYITNGSSSSTMLQPRRKSSGFPRIQETICGHTTDVLNFQVGVDIQNFFNPMLYFFKFILQWSQCGRYTALPNGLKNCIDFGELFQDRRKALYISEASLSTLVLLGQINIGFWVRNGTPVTHQARMYTRYSMREFTYMSDIFNVQFSMVLADPNDFFVTFISRWGLKHWANGFPLGDFPDPETTVAIVNQCFLLLIQLFTEIKSLTLVSSIDGFEKILKAEIIHALCCNNCTYSQIINNIPEHITKHAAFDLYLEKFTNYTPPLGLTDCGVYTLRPELRDEIDPFFIGMSSSKRYEAEKCIRTSMATKYKMNYEDTFIPPKKVITSLKNTPYFKLFAISSAETFGLFLKNTLDHINKFDYEGLLPVVTHVIHLCVVNNLNEFMKIFWHEYSSMEAADCYYQSVGSILYSFLLKDNFSSVHGTIREIFRYLTETAPHVDATSYLQEQVHSFNADVLWSSNTIKNNKDIEFERKKKMARIKKEKVIKKLARQQMQFIEKNSISTTDDEELKESSAESIQGEAIGWAFPENSCVFCKMPNEDDVFVYFSYQESNICDHNIDFSKVKDVINTIAHPEVGGAFTADTDDCRDSGLEEIETSPRMRLTSEGAVMRTCGHGSHVSCLGNHMKSIRAAHNQTTKNVPVTYGFGLLYCPLCNGLCNSFLPKPFGPNCNNARNFFENNFQCPNKDVPMILISTSLKAARICEDLSGELFINKEGLFNIINQIFVNTVSNTELSLRSQPADNSIHEMPNQRLLTLRLMSDLKGTLFRHFPCKLDLTEEVRPSNLFKLENRNIDLLSLASKAIEFLELEEHHHSGKAPLMYLKEIIKTKLWRDCVVLSKELLKVDFYRNCATPVPWSILIDSDENALTESTMLAEILKVHLFCLNPMIQSSYLDRIDSIKPHLHLLICGSLQVFLRRLCMIFYSHYAVEEAYVPEVELSREIDFLLKYLHLPSLSNIIREFCEKDSEKCFESFKTILQNNCTFDVIENITFTSPKTAKLVKLPNSFSCFALVEGNEIGKRTSKDERSICLFCGKVCRIQRSMPLHGYLQGECTNHVRNECKIVSTFGVFLMTKSNAIYLSYGDRGCFYPAPYLHKHGEPDEDFRLNNPVFLHLKRYEYLVNGIILGNMIPHIVFRLTDGNSDLGGWETM